MTGWLAQRTPLTSPLRVFALGLGLLGLVLGGCSGTQAHTYSLTMPQGVVRMGVDIENYRGHVEVIADDSARNITVDGWIWLSAETIDEGGDEPYALTDIQARVERSPEAPGSAILRVRTSSEHSEFLDHHVRLVVRAPRIDGLRIVNHDGFVEIEDASGAIEVENYSGGIVYRSSNPILDPVQILATDSNIWYFVPEGSQGEVVLETLDGRAIYKNTLSESTNTYTTTSQGGTDGSVIRTVLAGGTNPVSILTNRGDVHLVLMEDPLGHKQNFNFVFPEFRDYMKFNGSRRYKRNLPEDDYRSASQ